MIGRDFADDFLCLYGSCNCFQVDGVLGTCGSGIFFGFGSDSFIDDDGMLFAIARGSVPVVLLEVDLVTVLGFVPLCPVIGLGIGGNLRHLVVSLSSAALVLIGIEVTEVGRGIRVVRVRVRTLELAVDLRSVEVGSAGALHKGFVVANWRMWRETSRGLVVETCLGVHDGRVLAAGLAAVAHVR